MRIFCFSDLRVQPLSLVLKTVRDERADVILYAGDDLRRFALLPEVLLVRSGDSSILLSVSDMKVISSPGSLTISPRALEALRSMIEYRQKYTPVKEKRALRPLLSRPFFAVRGNDDRVLQFGRSEFLNVNLRSSLKRELAVKNDKIDLRMARDRASSVEFFSPANTTYGVRDIGTQRTPILLHAAGCTPGLESDATNTPDRFADIYLSHIPPLGTLDLSTRFGVEHVGSRNLRRAVLQYQPRFVVCGHSHFWGGNHQRIGRTEVINISNGDSSRDAAHLNYAVIDSKGWTFDLRTAIDRSRKRVMGFAGLKNILGYKTDLIDPWETNEDLVDMRSSPRYSQRVNSMKWKKPLVEKPLRLPVNKRIAYLDVETGLARGIQAGKLLLVGLWLEGRFKQFWFPRQRTRFFRFLKQKRVEVIVHWSAYDRRALKDLMIKRGIHLHFADARQRVGNCVVWHDYSLAGLHSALFPQELPNPLIEGGVAGIMTDHVIFGRGRCRYCPSKKQLRQEIRARNREDVMKLVEICETLS